MLKKQKVLIVVLTVLFAVMIAAYFVVVRPIIEQEEPVQTAAPVETEAAGEVVGQNDRILMFAHTEKENIRKLYLLPRCKRRFSD